MKLERKQLRLYAVTDQAWLNGRTLESQIEAVIDGGATMIQLREKNLDPVSFLEEAKWFTALCRKRGVMSIINDNVEIAKLSGADGVHVGQEDMAVEKAREALGFEKIVGVSAHNVEEALSAQAAGADYLGVGAVFVTTTKTDATPVPPETVRAITSCVEIPVVAIGGINQANILELGDCGVDGVAVISALFAQPDVKAATEQMRSLSDQIARK